MAPHGSLVGLRADGGRRLVVVREDTAPGPGTVVALRGPESRLVVGTLEKQTWAGWEITDEFGKRQHFPAGPWRLRGEVVAVVSVLQGGANDGCV